MILPGGVCGHLWNGKLVMHPNSIQNDNFLCAFVVNMSRNIQLAMPVFKVQLSWFSAARLRADIKRWFGPGVDFSGAALTLCESQIPYPRNTKRLTKQQESTSSHSSRLHLILTFSTASSPTLHVRVEGDSGPPLVCFLFLTFPYILHAVPSPIIIFARVSIIKIKRYLIQQSLRSLVSPSSPKIMQQMSRATSNGNKRKKGGRKNNF